MNKYSDKVTYINSRNLEFVPAPIQAVSNDWTRRANAHGDEGSCVLGAGFLFKFKWPSGKAQWYFMPPLCNCQGSISWESSYKEIWFELEQQGATDISYDWGNMD